MTKGGEKMSEEIGEKMLENLRKRLEKYNTLPDGLEKHEPGFELMTPGTDLMIGYARQEKSVGEEEKINKIIEHRSAQLDELNALEEKFLRISDYCLKNSIDLKTRRYITDARNMVYDKCEDIRSIIRSLAGQRLGYEDRKRLIKKEFKEIEKLLE